jgi:hypothetical protein
VFTYFGDNRRPGHRLHDTPRRGNLILADAFTRAHANSEARAAAPVFLLFTGAGLGRDLAFRGVAVPGVAGLSADEDLVAVWRTAAGERFQNYRAKFTVLDIPAVPRAWVRDVLDGAAMTPSAPEQWRRWVRRRDYLPLVAPRVGQIRTRAEQLPADPAGHAMLRAIRDRCGKEPVSFERVAAQLWRTSAGGRVELDLTRPSRDGGRDAVGAFFLGPAADQMGMEFALEAKCYSLEHGVGVREVSRLVSRLRHRQFGVLVTTSFVADQAYRELREDGHPVVILAGGDIVAILRGHDVPDTAAVGSWLDSILIP